jgi:diketogulonate reductase-like aldo/keto reductase
MKIGGVEVGRLGFGTWRMGGGFWTPDASLDQHLVEIMRYWIEKGVRLVDTAEMYGGGHTEELVGKAIKPYRRDDVFVVTKVWNNHLHREDLIKSARASLRRLDCGYIDLYLIHWPNPSVELKETISAMEELVEAGVVRYIGVSNFGVKELEEAIHAAKKYGIAVNQIEYNVLSRSPEKDVIPYCERNNVTVMAYQPLARGSVGSSRVVREVARKYNATPIQVALAYVMRRSLPIPMSTKKEHIDEILGSLRISLSDQDYSRLAESA